MPRSLLLLALVLVAAVPGCLDFSFTEPLSTGSAGAPGAAATTCRVPTADAGAARLRVAHLSPDGQSYDVCLRPVAGDDDDLRPLLRQLGSACPDGFHYGDVTTVLRHAAGPHVAFLVGAGAEDCATPLTEPLSVDLEDDVIRDVFMFQGEDGPTLKTFRETGSAENNRIGLRLVNGAIGVASLDLAIAGASSETATLGDPSVRFVRNAAYGGVGTEGLVPVDANGYLITQFGTQVGFWAGPSDGSDVLFAGHGTFAFGRTYTIFAIGNADDPETPRELLVCGDDNPDGIFADCGEREVSFDVQAVSLITRFQDYVPERRVALGTYVGHLDADVVCLGGATFTEDRLEIARLARREYPYVYAPSMTLTTPLNDPRTLDGTIVMNRADAACSQPDSVDALGKFADCLEATDCVGDDRKVLFGDAGINCTTSCVISQNALNFSVLANEPRCIGCVGPISATETVDDVRRLCGEPLDVTAGSVYANLGQSGQLILSRFPIRGLEGTGPMDGTGAPVVEPLEGPGPDAAEALVLPAQEYRYSVLRAPIELPSGRVVDVYCGEITEPHGDVNRPFYGPFGNGETGREGLREEQKLQIRQLQTWVRNRSGSRVREAVLLGQWNAGPEVPGTLEALNPESFDRLVERFALGLPVEADPICTECRDNPFLRDPTAVDNPVADGEAMALFPLLFGVRRSRVRAVRSSGRRPVIEVPLEAGADPTPIPMSPNYGVAVDVRF